MRSLLPCTLAQYIVRHLDFGIALLAPAVAQRLELSRELAMQQYASNREQPDNSDHSAAKELTCSITP